MVVYKLYLSLNSSAIYVFNYDYNEMISLCSNVDKAVICDYNPLISEIS